MLTSAHLKLIGRTGSYHINGITVYVTVKDVKSAYGNVRLSIAPVAGKGEVWVNEESVVLN